MSKYKKIPEGGTSKLISSIENLDKGYYSRENWLIYKITKDCWIEFPKKSNIVYKNPFYRIDNKTEYVSKETFKMHLKKNKLTLMENVTWLKKQN